MSKFLVIPDVHLKPWMFDQAMEIMQNTDCERAVCLGDLMDDWGKEREVELYRETLDKAIAFACSYPDTLWCYGNHDLAYLWDQYDHPGYSVRAAEFVRDKFEELRNALELPENLAVIHRADNVLFSHAGLTKEFVEVQLYDMQDDVDCVLETVNGFGVEELWEENSPLWARPQEGYLEMTMYPEDLFQVVGHTPVKEVLEQENLITTDTFSTYSNGMSFGKEEFVWVDSVTTEWGYF